MKLEDDMTWLNAALDDELDAERSLQFQARLARDPALRTAWEQQQALRKAIREGAAYHRAPAALRARIADTVAAHAAVATPSTPGQPRKAGMFANKGRRRWTLAAASVLIGAVFGAGLDWRLRERGSAADVAGPRIAEDAVAGHVRAILTGRLIDVASSDQHTVKPWLSARLTYSPPVPDLSAHGFELAGARRDVIDGQLVAALVYRRRQHIISAYVQPAPDRPVRPEPATRTFRGFNVIEATQGSLRYWIVSDLNVRELGDFADFLRAGG